MDTGAIITIFIGLTILAAVVLTRRKSEAGGAVSVDCDDVRKDLAVEKSKVEAKTAEISALRKEMEELRGEIRDFTAEKSRLDTLCKNAERQVNEANDAKNEAESRRDAKQEEINGLREKIAGLSADLNASKEKLDSQKDELDAMRKHVKNEFITIADEILKTNTKAFSESSSSRINEILKPLTDNLGEFKKKVEQAQTESRTDATELKTLIRMLDEQSKQMSEEAKNLTLALKGDSKVQGDWGEFQLEVLLERLDFKEGVHYVKQASFKDENNSNFRPDFVINLPDDKQCVIDCKVSLTAYERFFNSDDDGEKERALKEHVASVNRHIKELSGKRYEKINGINSPDFVLMFVPVEAALMLAIQSDSALVEDAARKNVMLVSTSTLLFALRTVAYIWKVENQNRNVQEIAEIGGDLYDKFVGFTENMIRVGNQMNSAKSTYEAAMNQLSKKNTDGSENAGTILGKIETMKKLGANATKQIDQNLLARIED
jgi:DNA recombination protein RmuC